LDIIYLLCFGLGQIDDAALPGFFLYFIEKGRLRYKERKDLKS